MTNPNPESDLNLAEEMAALRAEVEVLNSHRFIHLHNSILKLAGFQFLRGLAFGLGSVFGATILVSLLVYTLSTIDFIPIIGEWANEIADMIKRP